MAGEADDTSLTKIAGVFCFVSPIAILAGIVLLMRGGPLDLQSPASIIEAVRRAPDLVQSEAIALLGSLLALPITVGLYQVMKQAGSFVVLAAVMWCLGLVFVIVSRGVEISLVGAAAGGTLADDVSTNGVIAVLAFTSYLFGLIGSVLSMGIGILLFTTAQFRMPTAPKWLAVVGLVGTVGIGWIGRPGTFFFPDVAWPRIALLLGSVLGCIWLFAMSIVLLRWKPNAVAKA